MALPKSTFHELEVEASNAYGKKLEAKRQRAEERRERLLDARQRTIGLDMASIEAQIAEKEERKRAEKDEKNSYGERLNAFASLGSYMERTAAASKKEAQMKLKGELDAQVAAAHLRTTADLNVSTAGGARAAAEEPVRLGENDPRLGPASIQVFDGEDPLALQRKKLQAAQLASWSFQQTAERRAAAAVEKEMDMSYAGFIGTMTMHGDGMEAAAAAAKRAAAAAVAAENARAAQERKQVLAAKKEAERAEEVAAARTLVTPAAGYGFLAEDPAASISSANPWRLRPDHYRGSSPAAAVEVQKVRAEQAEASRTVKQLRSLEDAEQDAATQYFMKGALYIEREVAMAEAQKKAAFRIALQQQMEEDERRKRAEKEASKVAPTGHAFLSKFGKSDR